MDTDGGRRVASHKACLVEGTNSKQICVLSGT
jgi:hypothetical protein